MYADKPGKCPKCDGKGFVCFGGAVVNGVFTGSTGRCYSCKGKGHQTWTDIRRCRSYWRNYTRLNA